MEMEKMNPYVKIEANGWRIKEVTVDRSRGDAYCQATLVSCDARNVFSTFNALKELERLIQGSNSTKPAVKNVIFNDPATIIFWTDGTKTVVKCQEGDTYNRETGFVMAYLKKLLGNDNTFNKEIERWVPEESISKTMAKLGEKVVEGFTYAVANEEGHAPAKPRTFREKLAIEHPHMINEKCIGGCIGCPCTYGYEASGTCVFLDKDGMSNVNCTKCWDRELPKEGVKHEV